MFNPEEPESQLANESDGSFKDILSQFEQSKSRKAGEAGQGREGTVITVTVDSVLVDIGFKTEGILPLAMFQNAGETVRPGDKLLVSIKGRDPEGYYELTRGKVERPKDWASLEKAFADKETIVGTVTGVEEEERAVKERRYSEVKEGETIRGTVRSLTDYGAFIDIGGVDGLLHVSDISRSRVSKPEDVLSVGQELEVKVLKVDLEKRRISLGMKQLEPDPWESVTTKYKPGERARGTVTRVLDFGAFVELEPGIEGLIHVSEMSWATKVRTPSDVVKPGDTVEAVILGVSAGERRIALGLKQALGDPWADATQKLVVGSIIEGPITSLTTFGAFVQVSEGVEGMIHISDMSAERRINHPRDIMKVGQSVKAQVLEVDSEKRRLKLGIKQMLPSSIEEYIAEHEEGNVVSGRVMEISSEHARVELGEGIQGTCRIAMEGPAKVELT